MTLITSIRLSFEEAVHVGYPELDLNELSPEMLQSGRQSTLLWSGVPRIAKVLRLDPSAVAGVIQLGFRSENAVITRTTDQHFFIVAITTAAIGRTLLSMSQDPYLGVVRPTSQRVIVDLSAPNIAKELHVGHLRSTIIGDAIARLQEFLGHDVLRLNHIGDWGTQFGMLICYLKEQGIVIESLNLSQLMEYYRASRKQFDEDPAFKIRARAAVAKLQGGEEESMSCWKQICDVSRQAFQKIYDDLDVHLVERGESFYNPMLEPLVEELLSREIAVVSESAVCVFDSQFEAPFMLRKSDGGFGYDTTDLAALRHRITVEKAQKIICVVDEGQSQHFKQVKAVAIKAGILDPTQVDFKHVGFGVVLGADGHKLKTRSGDIPLLRDLLEEGISKASTQLKERGKEDDVKAKILGINAIKYADLKNSRQKTYMFNPDQMLEMKGHTVVYLLYVLARIYSLKEKAGAIAQGETFEIAHKKEIELGSQLVRFPDVIAKIDQTLEPHHLCDFLYHIAETFNAFYTECPVIEQGSVCASRLALCNITEKVLAKGLELLGIHPIKDM